MSRQTRPATSLRLGRSLALIHVLPRPESVVELGRCGQSSARWWARLLGVRPSILRRCILGRRVSVRAARLVETVLETRMAAFYRARITGVYR